MLSKEKFLLDNFYKFDLYSRLENKLTKQLVAAYSNASQVLVSIHLEEFYKEAEEKYWEEFDNLPYEEKAPLEWYGFHEKGIYHLQARMLAEKYNINYRLIKDLVLIYWGIDNVLIYRNYIPKELREQVNIYWS